MPRQATAVIIVTEDGKVITKAEGNLSKAEMVLGFELLKHAILTGKAEAVRQGVPFDARRLT